LGLSQSELARAAGITRQAVAAIESGRVQPTVGVALAIARRLEASVEELFGTRESGETLHLEHADATLDVGSRVVLANIGGRLVARAIDELPPLPGLVEAAGAVVSGTDGGGLRLRLLQSPASIDRTIFLAGCDLGVALLARRAARHVAGQECIWLSTSNEQALQELSLGRVHMAAVHVARGNDDRFAIPGTVGFEVSGLEEGWLVARGNPLKLTGARDLLRRRARLVNRPRGSGARALLDAELRRAGIAARSIDGYRHVLPGQLDVARAIAQDFADTSIGIGAVAHAFRLDFIPLRQERCLLVVPQAYLRHPGVETVIDTLRSPSYRRDLEAIDGYDTRRTGERVV